MTREERGRREAERSARMAEGPDIGGITLPFSRITLLKAFWAFVVLYPAYILWTARSSLDFESMLSGSALFVACLLPGWFWVTGRVQGLPIFPIFALGFLPTYVAPLWQGHVELKNYTANQINTAAWTVAGFLLVSQLFWQQIVVKAVKVPNTVRMIDLKRSAKILLVCLFAEVVFELVQILLWQFGAGGVSAFRGFATSAGRMGNFVFSYQLGKGELKTGLKFWFLSLLIILVVQETASLLLANVLPTLGIAFTGYILGSGKIPWKTIGTSILCISVLHAGKYEMREIYFDKPKPKLIELPEFFEQWVGLGIKNLGLGQPHEEKKEVTSSAERASVIQVMIRVQTKTPEPLNYLDGITYEFIPSLLVPRILSPEKLGAHTGNSILSIYYGYLLAENVNETSVAFDLIIEAYANYGWVGVLLLSIIMGFFIGWITIMTIHVPMLSFGFLFGVQTIAILISSFNTAGVFITSIWQAFLALAGLSFILMRKEENPMWKYYTLKIAEKVKVKKEAKHIQTFEEVKKKMRSDEGGQMAVGGPTSLQTSPTREELRRVEDETAPVIHERPTRFVYGENKAKQKS